MNSGIDIANIVAKNEEIHAEEHVKSDENQLSFVEEETSNSEKSSQNRDNTSIKSNGKKLATKADGEAPNEKTALLNMSNKLEHSSKGKVKGSLFINYLKSANNYCLLGFLGISFLLSQMLANFADIWVAYW